MLRQEMSRSLSSSMDITPVVAGTNTGSTGNNVHHTMDTAMVRDVIEASVFFATSLGRLGGDFTCQLISIFEPMVLQIITEQYWKPGIQQFHHTLEICRDAGMAGPLSTTTTTFENETDNKNQLDDLSPSRTPWEEPQAPPKHLLTLPPLARFVNAILTGLNELRRCLLPGIFIPLRQYMKTNVIDVMIQELDLNERMVLTPGLRGEAMELRSMAVQMKETFHTIVEPYILGSLEAAIGFNDGATLYHTLLYNNMQQTVQEPQSAVMAESEPHNVEEIDNDQIEQESESTTNLPTIDTNAVVVDVNDEDADMVQDVHEHDNPTTVANDPI